VQSAVQGAKKADGTEPAVEWKASADKTLSQVQGCNNPDRVDLAHNYLEPHSDGSVSLQKPGLNPKTWTSEDFDAKIKKLKNLTLELRAIGSDLTKLEVSVPRSWIMMDAYQPPRRQYPASDLGMGGVTAKPRAECQKREGMSITSPGITPSGGWQTRSSGNLIQNFSPALITASRCSSRLS
jgi:hypothetical protein